MVTIKDYNLNLDFSFKFVKLNPSLSNTSMINICNNTFINFSGSMLCVTLNTCMIMLSIGYYFTRNR